jgi:spore maturation protein SpmA
MLNHLWAAMIALAAAAAGLRLMLSGDTAVITQMSAALFDSAKVGFELAFGLVAVLALWLGLFKIAEEAGIARALARWVSPLLARLLPGVPLGHPAHHSISMNVAMSVLGLDNAALPAGLKAMEELERLNPVPGSATPAQQVFMVYMTASVTLLPISILSYRMQTGSAHSASVMIPLLLAGSCGLVAGLLYMSAVHRIRWHYPVPLGLATACSTLLVLAVWTAVWGSGHLPAAQVAPTAALWGNGALLLAAVGFVLTGWVRGVPVFDTFVKGAGEGFRMAVQLIPYVLGMLVAIGLLRASGVFGWVQTGSEWAATALGLDTRWVAALPQMAMKPFSGSGARGFMLDAFKHQGPDSFPGHVASVVQGASDTTLYCLTVCAGAARLRVLGHAVQGSLVVWSVSSVAAVLMAYLFFGG